MFPLRDFTLRLPRGARVLDVGCWDASFYRRAIAWGRTDLVHFGVDRESPPGPLPSEFDLKIAALDREPLPFPDEWFDATILSHVVEHVPEPVRLISEGLRVLKPGGQIYVEAPSERSLWFPSMPFRHDEARSLSFFDDPTHVGRPQTPQSLYRSFRMCGAEPLAVGHIVFRSILFRSPWLLFRALVTKDAALLETTVWRAFGFAAFGIAQRDARNETRYVLPKS